MDIVDMDSAVGSHSVFDSEMEVDFVPLSSDDNANNNSDAMDSPHDDL